MQTKPKANSIVTSRYDENRNVIVFSVRDQGECELDLNKVAETNHKRAAIHGWNQRIPDAAAISRTDKDGHLIPEGLRSRIKFERMNELCRHYESGTDRWSMVREGDGTAGRALTVEAIARLQGIDYSEAERRVEALAEKEHEGDTQKALTLLRKSPTLAKVITEIRSERAEKGAGAQLAEQAESALRGLEG